MVKKNKLRYKNFNICQLVDKGKLKLQYTDEFKESKKNFGKITKQIVHEDKKHKIEKDLGFTKSEDLLQYEKEIVNLINFSTLKPVLKNNITYEFIKNCCKFVEIKNKLIDTNYFAILILEDCGLLTDIETSKNHLGFTIVNEEEIEPYLISFDMVKEEYTLDELKEIFYKYIQNKQNINKKLIK